MGRRGGVALEGTFEGYFLLALALFQGFLGLYVLLGFPRRDWNPVIGVLFLFNGFGALGVAGWSMAVDAASIGFWELATVVLDTPTVFVILYFVLTFPRPLLGEASRRPLALLIGGYVAVWTVLLASASAPWIGMGLNGYPDATTLAASFYIGAPTYLIYAFAAPVLAYHLVELRDRPRQQGQVGIFLAAVVLRTGFISPVNSVFDGSGMPTNLFSLLLHLGVAGAVAWMAWHFLANRVVARWEAGFVLAAYPAGIVLGSLDAGLQSAIGLAQPPLNRLELFLVRPLLFLYALGHYQVLDRPGRMAGATFAGAAAVLGAGGFLLVLGLDPAFGTARPWPGSVALALGLAGLAATVGTLAATRVLPALGGTGTGRRERLELYRHAAELAVLADGPGSLDGEALRQKAEALRLTDLEQRLVRAEVAAPETGKAALSKRYLVERTLARTPHSEVVLARDAHTGQPRVLKRLPAGLAHAPEARRRIAREAAVLGQLRHPHVVTVHDTVVSEADVFLVLEYVEGGSLADRLGQGPLPAPEALRIAAELLDALAHAHAQGVVHRDIKPANVLLTRGGAVKLADFGIAAWRHGAGATRATVGPVGTPLYMAPEQARGAPAGPPADLYSVGVLLHLMLTGEPPIPGWRDLDDWALQQRVARGGTRLAATVPAPMRPVLQRALRARPDQRFADSATMARALRAAAAGLKPEAPLRAGG